MRPPPLPKAPAPATRHPPPQDWDQGYSEAAKAGTRPATVKKHATEDVMRLPLPGSPEYALAQRFKQLQADYQAAKQALRLQLQQAEQQLLVGVSALLRGPARRLLLGALRCGAAMGRGAVWRQALATISGLGTGHSRAAWWCVCRRTGAAAAS